MYFEKKRYFSCLSVAVTELRTHGLPQAAKWQQIHIEGLIPGKHWWQRGMRYKSTGKRSQRSWPASGAPRHKIRSTAGQMKQLKCRLPQKSCLSGDLRKNKGPMPNHIYPAAGQSLSLPIMCQDSECCPVELSALVFARNRGMCIVSVSC